MDGARPGSERVRRLRVETPGVPRPALLRVAIEERLAGRAFAGRAEDAVAKAVADAVRTRGSGTGAQPWR
jgi:formaldehyde-activating enzyme involved in methanogenesis